MSNFPESINVNGHEISIVRSFDLYAKLDGQSVYLMAGNDGAVKVYAPHKDRMGGYVVSDSKGETPEAVIIATGSEVSLAVKAQKALEGEIDVRVVSMPCVELFEQQTKEYKESVLPSAVRQRVAVEALSGYGWEKYTGLDGKVVCMSSFGASAPYSKLFEHFGFTVDAVVDAVKEVVK